MTTALAVIDPQKIEKLDSIAGDYALIDASKSPFGATFTLAQSVGQLRALLTPDVMQPIIGLMNSPLGFLTDRDPARPDKNGKTPEPYSADVVRDVVIEATLRGFYPAGNEFNIISGRFYAAKAGIRRKVTTWKGLTDFKDFYEVPRMISESGALVKARATWKLGGVEDTLEREFAIRVNAHMGADSISGKAERKLLKAVLDRISGIITPDGDIDDSAVPANDDARFASAKPAFAHVETTPPPAAAPKAQEPAPAQTPSPDSTPATNQGQESNATGPHDILRDWLEAQGIMNQEIMRYAHENNIGSPVVARCSSLKPEDVEKLLSQKQEIYKSIEGYRKQAKK